MLNHCSVQLSQGHQSQPSKNTNLIMTLIVLRSIQQFTKLFSRKLIPLWALVWISLHHPLRYYNPFLPPSLSLLLLGQVDTPPTLSAALPSSCWLHASFMLSLDVLYSLTTFPISLPLGKAHNPSLSPTDCTRNLYKALVTLRLDYLSMSVSFILLYLSFCFNSWTMHAWHRRYSIPRDSLSLPSSSRDVPFSRKS